MEPPLEDLDEIVARASTSMRWLAGRSVLVAGAGGFIGAYICHAIARANDTLLERACSLICLDNFRTGTRDRLRSLEARSDCSILDVPLEDLVELGADVVVHAASIASPPVYRRFPLETIEVNVLGTWNLLRLAQERSAASFLHLSSSEVYGDPDEDAIPTGEEYVGRVSFTGPRACYDESKRLSETLCRLYFERHGLNVKVVRPFNVYGPTLRLDDGRIIPDLFRQGLEGGPLVLHSDGTPTRSFCYVTDFVAASLQVLASDRNGEAFNVGTPEEISIRAVATLIGELLGVQEIRTVTSGDGRYLTDNPQRRCPDIRKIRDQIGWTPQVPLREGLRRTASYYRARQA
jgi:dTDP-glucose 4,6-dehydratase/UDP-glucuronate decarboxylase